MLWLTTGLVLVAMTAAMCAPGAGELSLDAGSLQMTFDPVAEVVSLRDPATDKEYLPEGASCQLLTLKVGDESLRPVSLRADMEHGRVELGYGDGSIRAMVKVAVKPTHVTFELASITGAELSRIDWGPFLTTIGKTVGAVVGVVRDDTFAIGIQSLNIQTIGQAGRRDHGSVLHAYAIEHDGGVLGSKVALFGCPAGKALETIGAIELAEGLPHPMLDGVWGKVSPTARLSYLIVSFGENNIDAVLDLAAKGGFKYVYHPGPFRTWGHFELNPGQFPDGDESLARCAEKAAKRGIRLGLHTLTGFITTNDPYVTPVPDPRLARWGSSTLASAISASATEIPVADPHPFRRRGTLSAAIIGEEIIRYESISDQDPWRLMGCTRGAFGTRASEHPSGADIGKLADHAYRTLYPGIENGMMDEMTQRLVELFNRTGLRQMSFDGLEGLSTYGYGQYARNRFVSQCFENWDNEVISDASNLLHYLWHIHTRMNWGELTQSAKVDVDHYRAKNCAFFEENLFPKALGWWRLGGVRPDWEATRLEDVQYLLAKAAGFEACHGLQTDPNSVRALGHGDACLAMVKAWDEARYLGAFTSEQREKLREAGRDFRLDPTGDRRWRLTELDYSPFFWSCPGTGRSTPPDSDHVLSFAGSGEVHPGNVCTVRNPFDAQPLRFELWVLPSFDPGNEGNLRIDLPDPERLKPAPGLPGGALSPAAERETVAGADGYRLRMRNDSDRASELSALSVQLPKPLDLRQRRGLGYWVRGDGGGQLLFVQLSSRGAHRHYYTPIDFVGARYFEYPSGEMCLSRFYDYAWHSLAPWHTTLKGFDYGQVDRITLGFIGVPAGHEADCGIAGLTALKELGASAQNVRLRLGEREMVFADSVPAGHYLVLDSERDAEVQDANHNVLRRVPASGGPLTLQPGKNRLELSCDGDGGPAPWLRLEVECRGPAEDVVAPTE